MRCLVTGASGFLGSHLVRELLARQYSVAVLLRPGARTERLENCLTRVSIIRGSLDDMSELQRTIKIDPVDAAIHLAWSGITAEHRDSAAQVTYNVIHSLELWKVLRDSGCKVFLGAGSQAEYGPYAGALREDYPKVPVTAYGSAKLALGILLERLCANAGMRFVWMRIFSAYGPADDERRMLPWLIRTLLRGEKPSLTAGEQVWDYLYVADIVNAFCASLECEASGAFNLASGTPCLLRDFIWKVRDCIDPGLPLGIGEVPYTTGQVMHMEADIGRLKDAIGWTPSTDHTEGIRRTVEWYKNRCMLCADLPGSNCLAALPINEWSI